MKIKGLAVSVKNESYLPKKSNMTETLLTKKMKAGQSHILDKKSYKSAILAINKIKKNS